MNREHVPELVECAECGREFDLARQDYFFNFCPRCHRASKRGRS